ncbi:MAG: hypothetical protein DRN12_03815 [Thermoplasmata archaeon]|nr:MAG: hypothetical protein DRN12_03815 [Thermoplasmata archaeon]
MATYEEVKGKIENAVMQILEDMAYKRIVFANKYTGAVEQFVKEIMAELNNALNIRKHENIDTYFAEIYSSASMQEIGAKAVKPEYDDELVSIGGRTVIPFDTFKFDPEQYELYSKMMGDRFSKYLVLFRIPLSESPPAGDFEDIDYAYYLPNIFYSNIEFVHDLYQELSEYGYLPEFLEFVLFQVLPTKVRFIKGAFDYFRRDIDTTYIACDVCTGGVVKGYDAKVDEWKEIAYKFSIIAWNYTTYTVEVVIGGKPHKVEANKCAVYLYLTDMHLKATPIKILEVSI